MKIWANTIANNEENFLWFAVSSVIEYVDKVLIWDTGSTDKTVDVIKQLQNRYGEKIVFREVGKVDKNQFTKYRQQMLEQSDCDWLLILDGDEVWWKESIEKVVKVLQVEGYKLDGVVVPMKVPVGDIFHLQEEAAGRYVLLGKKGHYNLRLINRHISGLHVDWPYGMESYLDDKNTLIQEKERITFVDAPYLHLTHLRRSNLRRSDNKIKHELGDSVKHDFKFPEVFYDEYPSFIADPWNKISGVDLVKARILTPLRKLKRRFL